MNFDKDYFTNNFNFIKKLRAWHNQYKEKPAYRLFGIAILLTLITTLGILLYRFLENQRDPNHSGKGR